MLALTTEQQDALLRRNVMRRFFVWVDALNLEGEPDPVGFWDDVGDVEVDERTYRGGVMFSISTLSARSDFSIPSHQIVVSGVDPRAIELLRGDILAQRPIEIAMGIFDVDSHTLIPPLITRFIGKIDDVDAPRPRKGDAAQITFTLESTSRSLTIRRTETRSKASLSLRSAPDRFYDYTSAVTEKTIYFGRKAPIAPRKGGSGGGGTDGGGDSEQRA